MNSETNQAAGRRWAWAPVLLLGSMLSGLATLTYIAVDDPHFALEPNYYDKAVHWDQARTAAQQSHQTGFRAELAPLLESGGVAELRLQLRDRNGAPVVGATVAVEAFPNAYAARVARTTLREVAPGTYAAQLHGAAPGLWELRLSATSASRHFQQIFRRDITKRGAA